MSARPLNPLVDEADTWGTDEWWRLELRSFDDAPNAQLQLAMLGPKAAWTTEYGGRPSVGGCLQTLAYIVAVAAPTVGAAWMLRWFFVDEGSLPLVFAAVMTLVSLLVTVPDLVTEARRPRAIAMNVVRRVSLVHVVPAAVTIAITLSAVATGRYDAEVDASLLWLLPVVADLVIFIVKWVRGSASKNGPQNPLENLEWSVREIDDSVKLRIRAARDEAIRRLESQNKIDHDTATRALETELGQLALTLAPEGRSGFYPAQ
ncbi:hypothetical protein [Microbacterium sp. C7(2022)]|uniref:hypothetical protein n=1 Tax=Microbacterium sp. C7(2022) TaxID=2992759 RepID=UPI00237AD4E2|nr:hypothetical protein [Microbacterium sp. C7(2022)]MDE0547488.1 hypothetical protein [Microbacterium sp. C7(2022)]